MANMGIGSIKRSFKDDKYCGDQFGYWQKDLVTILCIADGLGHGKHAEKAAKAALTYVASHRFEPLPEIFSGCNRAIRDTRGVAMGIAIIDEKDQTLTYAGIGNTRILILRNTNHRMVNGKSKYLKSNFGIVGGGYKHLLPETIQLMPGDRVIMYTDGVKELIDFSGYEEDLLVNPGKLAERIIEDWGRATDDAAVLVFKSEVHND